MSDHSQFAPYEPPFMKLWRERLDAPQKGKKSRSETEQSSFADKELDKVVKRIKKKPPNGGCG